MGGGGHMSGGGAAHACRPAALGVGAGLPAAAVAAALLAVQQPARLRRRRAADVDLLLGSGPLGY
jgi:hypothetical protein